MVDLIIDIPFGASRADRDARVPFAYPSRLIKYVIRVAGCGSAAEGAPSLDLRRARSVTVVYLRVTGIADNGSATAGIRVIRLARDGRCKLYIRRIAVAVLLPRTHVNIRANIVGAGVGRAATPAPYIIGDLLAERRIEGRA